MSQRFGTASAKQTEHDRLGRARRLLSVGSIPNNSGEEPAVFDLDELEWMAAHGEFPELAYGIGSRSSLDPRVALLHALLPGTFVLEVHADGLCTLGEAPDARANVEAALGRDVRWSSCPSTPAAVATLVGSDEGPILIAGLGLFLSGASRSELDVQADRLDGQATAFLTRSRPPSGSPLRPESRTSGLPEPTDLSGPTSLEAENLLASVRGLLAVPDRVVFAVSAAASSYATNPALGRLLETAGELEPHGAADGIRLIPDVETARPSLSRPAEDAEPKAGDPGDGRHHALPPRAGSLFLPSVGLVGVGRDEIEAESHLRSAVHRLAVATALLANEPSAEKDAPDSGTGGGRPPADQVVPVGTLGTRRDPASGPLLGRVFIVTGAASGIGRDIARHLSSLGASLSLADVNGESLDATADELVRNGVRPLAISGDLTDEAVVDRLVTATVRRFGGLDGAVLNAGVALPGEITKLSAADWRRSLEVNATSHFLLVKRLLPVLQTQGIGGSLVFIGSKNMFSPGAGFGAYSASKGALAQLARIVAIEGGPSGIRSNIVNPDNVFDGSRLWSPELRAQRAAVYGIRPEDLETYYTQRNLLKVPISGRDVAKGVAFLLSDDACRTTACVLTVDGGVPGVFPR